MPFDSIKIQGFMVFTEPCHSLALTSAIFGSVLLIPMLLMLTTESPMHVDIAH